MLSKWVWAFACAVYASQICIHLRNKVAQKILLGKHFPCVIHLASNSHNLQAFTQLPYCCNLRTFKQFFCMLLLRAFLNRWVSTQVRVFGPRNKKVHTSSQRNKYQIQSMNVYGAG